MFGKRKLMGPLQLIAIVFFISLVSINPASCGRIPLSSIKWSQFQYFDFSVCLNGPIDYRVSLFNYSKSCFTGVLPLGLGIKAAEVTWDTIGTLGDKRFRPMDELTSTIKLVPFDITYLIIGWKGTSSDFSRSKYNPNTGRQAPPGYVWVTTHEFKTISPILYLRTSICPWALRKDGPADFGSTSGKKRLSQTVDVSLNLMVTTVASWNFEASVGLSALRAPSKWGRPKLSENFFYIKLSTGFGAFRPSGMLKKV